MPAFRDGLDRKVDGRIPKIILGLAVRAAPEELGHTLLVAFHRSKMQGSPAIFVPDVNVGPPLQQEGHDIGACKKGSPMQSSPASAYVDLHPVIEQHPHHREMA